MAAARNVKLATFNTESDYDTTPYRVAETMESIQGVDIWALQEVESPEAASLYRSGAGDGLWRYVVSESGGSDLLVVLYRTDLFRHVETLEYHAIRSEPGDSRYGRPSWGLRGAQFVRFQHWNSGEEFYVGNVHLKCCGGEGPNIRAHQAGLLRDWMRRLDAPVILVGDFNIPVAPESTGGASASAFNTLKETPLVWVRPENPLKTQCDPQFNSMLDLIFHSPSASDWEFEARIQKPELAYCELDEKGYADHRPVVVTFELP